jgi:hypothetical protein
MNLQPSGNIRVYNTRNRRGRLTEQAALQTTPKSLNTHDEQMRVDDYLSEEDIALRIEPDDRSLNRPPILQHIKPNNPVRAKRKREPSPKLRKEQSTPSTSGDSQETNEDDEEESHRTNDLPTTLKNTFTVDQCDPFFQTLSVKPIYRFCMRQDIVDHHKLPNGVPLPCRLHLGPPLIDGIFFVIPKAWDPFLQEYTECIGYFRSIGCALSYIMSKEVGNKFLRAALAKKWASDRYGLDFSKSGPSPPMESMKPYGTLEFEQCCSNVANLQCVTILPVRYSMAPVVEEIYRQYDEMDERSSENSSSSVSNSGKSKKFSSGDVRFKNHFCEPATAPPVDDATQNDDMRAALTIPWTKCPAPWQRTFPVSSSGWNGIRDHFVSGESPSFNSAPRSTSLLSAMQI